MKLCLVASSGGHLMELYFAREAWQDFDRFWITFPAKDADSLLANERVLWAYHPTNRNLKNLIKNIWLAWKILRRENPDAILSTGAGVGVPFIWIGWLLRIPTIFVESMTFTDKQSMSGKLVYPVVDHYFVQWPDLDRKYGKARYRGQVM